MDITTVADDLIVAHDGTTVHRWEGLDPAREHDIGVHVVHTLPRPSGELLCTFATVNDVHFGELECGRIGDHREGPIQRVGPDETPYPEVMNAGAIAEIAAIDPIAVVAKGDLTSTGTDEQFATFEARYGSVFGDRLYAVRGNHDAYEGQQRYTGDQWIELPGVAIALLDTVIPHQTTGTITPAQLAWLDERAATADRPVIVMGHHQQWINVPGMPVPAADAHESIRNDGYFGLHPDASDALGEVMERRPRIVAYTAGHTHRHRVRHTHGGVPTIEVGCVKDFPGTWAEYRVYEGGIMQVVHRVSTPEALEWSERCRHLYSDFGVDYEHYALGGLSDRCFVIGLRGDV